MKFRLKTIFIITVILAFVNILIFIFRNKGFEYVRYSDKEELYAVNPDSSFFRKWSAENERFSYEQLYSGVKLLKDSIGLDSIKDDRTKMIKTAAWIFRRFRFQVGQPEDTLNKLDPLQQYHYLNSHPDKKLWCGHFQRMFGFFITSAGLINRYVEIVPKKIDSMPDFHEVNEVYLKEENIWIMVDVTRNFLMIRANEKPLSAAEYFDFRLEEKPGRLFFIKAGLGELTYIDSLKQSDSLDKYFNRDYLLRYYHSMDLSKVYATQKKMKRYILPDPWYEMYDPLNRHSNILFTVKQFLFIGMLLTFLFWIIGLVIRSKTKGKS
jgi:hypothetical protein